MKSFGMRAVGIVSLLQYQPWVPSPIFSSTCSMSGSPSASLSIWVWGLWSSPPPSLNCSAGTNLFGTGRPWVDRWPEPQLSIWPVKLSKKASSLQIRALISLPTVWPVGVSGLCQGGEEEEENSGQGVGRAREGGRCLQGPALRMGLVLMARRQGRTALLAGPKGLHRALLWGEVSKINPWNHWSKPLDNCV